MSNTKQITETTNTAVGANFIVQNGAATKLLSANDLANTMKPYNASHADGAKFLEAIEIPTSCATVGAVKSAIINAIANSNNVSMVFRTYKDMYTFANNVSSDSTALGETSQWTGTIIAQANKNYFAIMWATYDMYQNSLIITKNYNGNWQSRSI